jgi:hypothetical protein
MLYTYALLTSPFRIRSQTKKHLHHLLTSTTNEVEAELGYSGPDIARIPDMPVSTSALRPAHPQLGLPWLSTDPCYRHTLAPLMESNYGGHKLYNNKCIPDNYNKFALETFMNNTTDKRRSNM